MLIHDAHCHLQDEALERYLPEVAEVYRQIGVGYVVVNGTCESDWKRVAALAKSYSFVRPAFGLHPWKVKEASPNWKERLLRFLDQFPTASIGEVGLDRWIKDFDLDLQEECFRAQLGIAVERELPVSVHCLQAWGRMFEVLSEQNYRSLRFLLHSYGGSQEMVGDFEKLGAYFSISGYFSLDRKFKQREAFKAVSRDRLLIETDAPEMGGVEKYRKYRIDGYEDINHPGNIAGVYAFVVSLLGLEEIELATIVDRNLKRFLGET